MAQQRTLTHDERVQGWTSFHSFLPDWMIGMNNRFFTFKGGNLFLHHSRDTARNNYYGVQYPTKISVMVNDNPSDIKFFKAMSTEGNTRWNVVITGYISSLEDFNRSSLTAADFVKKEGVFYSNFFRNEQTDRSSKSNYGIGVVESFVGADQLLLSMDLPFSLAVGDTILNVDEEVVGMVLDVIQPRTIQLSAPPVNLSPGDFVLGVKDSRVEGGEIRGYTARIDLENDSNTKSELFAVNAEIAKSYA